MAALTPENEIEVEEAFFQTLALGRGFTLKGGRFLSGIGYQNEIHQHAWDFQDAPLAYKAFLGGKLNDDGIQLRWLAPTELFLELAPSSGAGACFRRPTTTRTAPTPGAFSATLAATSARASRGARGSPISRLRRETARSRISTRSAAR